jgi:hypothetical protein
MPTNDDIFNFDLCDLQKWVKSKTCVLCHAYLLYTYDKNLEKIQPLVQE